MGFLKGLLITCLLIASFSAGIFFYLITHPPVYVSLLEQYDAGTASIVLDDEGAIIARFQRDKRDPITLKSVSPVLIQAFLAAEDQHFFIHHGISLKSIIRSCIANFYRGKIVQGASTITQQLVKLLFLDNRKTLRRKIKELCMALIIEAHMSKEQILESYINNVYFGSGIYGIQAACKRFWQKSSSDLTIAQAATLAGIVQSPERLCPLINPEKTIMRRNSVIKRMLKQGRITSEEAQTAYNENLGLQQVDDECCAPHVKEMIRHFVEAYRSKHELYSGGLVIQTTVSQKLQKKSVNALKKHLLINEKKSNVPLDGAIMVLNGSDGKIKALVGGKNFKESQFNRVTQARRQLGSIFKPLIFAAALEEGASMSDICTDEPITIMSPDGPWRPQNYNHTFVGPVTRAYGLYKSLNTIAIQTLYTAGIERVIDIAHRCGLNQELQPYPSLALGCVDATLWQATRIFNCFAQQGILIEPYVIQWIKDKQGKKIYKHADKREQVIDWIITSQITATLCAGMEQLRKKNPHDILLQRLAHVPVMAKTGTTNDARSCFCIASTPVYTVAAYLGNDDNKAMGSTIFASRTVRPLVLDILAMMPHSNDTFKYFPDLKREIIDEISGKPLSTKNDPRAIEIFIT